MSIAPGTRLGPYEILAPIGAGGMGEVFRARDTRLDRSVAIKILPTHLSSNPQLRERFDREARAISSLSHPHICALYDVGHQDGTDYIVMEYLEGESLADRLARGPLPIEQVIRYGAQIAEALERAHKAGIVHRDLKPGNVMITKAGAKLLDFGLARRAQGAAISPDDPTKAAHAGQTERKPLTEEGTILGTFQYMAPEQVEGREADPRTDIFALGTLLYEMATGKRAFEGKSRASLIASILDREPPPISTIQPLTPVSFERVVRTCMAKEPDERWQSAHDVAAELKWIGEADAEPALGSARPTPRNRREVAAWVTAAVFAAALLLVILTNPGSRATSPSVRFGILPPHGASWTDYNSLSISPDGRHLVFYARGEDPRGMLFIREIDSLATRALPGTEDASFPFWSPDSRYIGFFVPGKMKKISINGGPPQTLCDARDGRGGTWNGEGVILFAPDSSSVIHRVSAAGGLPTSAGALDLKKGETSQTWPKFLPDGKHFVYRSRRGAKSAIYVAQLAGTARPQHLVDADAAALAPPGHLLFLRESVPLAQRFDFRRRKLEGEPFPIAEELGFNPGSGYAAFSCSDTGTLMFRSSTERDRTLELTWFERSGKAAGIVAKGLVALPALSPTGRQAAYASGKPADVWSADLIRGTTTRLTFDERAEFAAVWSPDSTLLAYAMLEDQGLVRIVTTPANGTEALRVIGSGNLIRMLNWSRDGKYIVFDERDENWNISAIEIATGKKIPVVHSPVHERDPSISPDGKWIAYTALANDGYEVFVQPFPGGGGKRQISTNGGFEPKWKGDGHELYFVTNGGGGQMMAAELTFPPSGGVDVALPRPLFPLRLASFQYGHYDVSADGERFLAVVLPETHVAEPITVVLNWSAELARR